LESSGARFPCPRFSMAFFLSAVFGWMQPCFSAFIHFFFFQDPFPHLGATGVLVVLLGAPYSSFFTYVFPIPCYPFFVTPPVCSFQLPIYHCLSFCPTFSFKRDKDPPRPARISGFFLEGVIGVPVTLVFCQVGTTLLPPNSNSAPAFFFSQFSF